MHMNHPRINDPLVNLRFQIRVYKEDSLIRNSFWACNVNRAE